MFYQGKRMPPKQQARKLIDPPSEAAGWHVCDTNNKKSIESDPNGTKLSHLLCDNYISSSRGNVNI
jgi:hypothetical protein